MHLGYREKTNDFSRISLVLSCDLSGTFDNIAKERERIQKLAYKPSKPVG